VWGKKEATEVPLLIGAARADVQKNKILKSLQMFQEMQIPKYEVLLKTVQQCDLHDVDAKFYERTVKDVRGNQMNGKFKLDDCLRACNTRQGCNYAAYKRGSQISYCRQFRTCNGRVGGKDWSLYAKKNLYVDEEVSTRVSPKCG
jgi:hypothetical protein